MVFNTTFSYIVAVCFIGGENHRPVASHWLYHIMYTSSWSGFELTLVVIGTDCIGSCKSNYRTIMTTWILRDTGLKIFKMNRKFLHGSLYDSIYPRLSLLHIFGEDKTKLIPFSLAALFCRFAHLYTTQCILPFCVKTKFPSGCVCAHAPIKSPQIPWKGILT
jgi:hypothetical protein